MSASGDAFTAVYLANYHSLIRLAALLVDDRAGCEDVVQDAYVRVYASRTRLRDESRALAYLRQTVVNLSRSSLRRAMVARRRTGPAAPDPGGPDEVALDRIAQTAVVQALRRLPRRQREVLVLRYYADLSEADVRTRWESRPARSRRTRRVASTGWHKRWQVGHDQRPRAAARRAPPDADRCRRRPEPGAASRRVAATTCAPPPAPARDLLCAGRRCCDRGRGRNPARGARASRHRPDRTGRAGRARPPGPAAPAPLRQRRC